MINSAIPHNDRPPPMTAARPRGPNRSLPNPTANTDTPPKNGNNALAVAARAGDNSVASAKYVGVQVVKASRSSVQPSDRRQTYPNERLRKSGPSNERQLLRD